MFLGTHTPRLDDKGRLTLPAKFRDELAGGLMITKGQDHCLYVFPRDEFEQMARKVADAPFTDERVRAYQRYLFAGTDEQRPDSQGRIPITAELRRYAGLDRGLHGHRGGQPPRDLGQRGLDALPGRARGRLRAGSAGSAARRLLTSTAPTTSEHVAPARRASSRVP